MYALICFAFSSSFSSSLTMSLQRHWRVLLRSKNYCSASENTDPQESQGAGEVFEEGRIAERKQNTSQEEPGLCYFFSKGRTWLSRTPDLWAAWATSICCWTKPFGMTLPLPEILLLLENSQQPGGPSMAIGSVTPGALTQKQPSWSLSPAFLFP